MIEEYCGRYCSTCSFNRPSTDFRVQLSCQLLNCRKNEPFGSWCSPEPDQLGQKYIVLVQQFLGFFVCDAFGFGIAILVINTKTMFNF